MIYVLITKRTWEGYTDITIKGATTSEETANRWKATSSYILDEIHDVLVYTEEDARQLVMRAEAIEKEREKNYGEANDTGRA